jgi:dephospho-CoA kinase
MIKIGITGSVASGKSELLKSLIKNGFAGFNCDVAVHELHNEPEIQNEIMNIFPQLQKFDKIEIAKIIYSSPDKRKALEDLIHPMVGQKMSYFLKDHSDSKVVFLEIPLLFEAKWESHCDYIVSLYCERKIRKQRAVERGMSPEIFELIDQSQLPEQTKVELADFSIDTNCSLDDILTKCENFIKFVI